MPFKSQAQRRYLYSQHPEVAKEFEKATPEGKKLPPHVKGRGAKLAQEMENLKHMSHVGSHPKHAPHMGHGEHQGAHHHTDGSHKTGSGKKTVEMLNHEHSQHSDLMGKTVVAKPAAHPQVKSEGKVSVKTESKPLPPPSGKKGY